MYRVRVTVAIAALVWMADPLPALAQGFDDPCDKNHYILNAKCDGQAGGDSPELGVATKADVVSPGAIAADAAGNVYFASGAAIYKIDANGALTRFAGTGTPGFSGDGGPAALADIAWAGGIAVDAAGNLYVADTYNHRVRKVDVLGAITTVAGSGRSEIDRDVSEITEDSMTDGLTAQAAQITYPAGVAVDSTGTLYVASNVSLLRKITPDGIISTMADVECGFDFLTSGFCGSGGQIAVDHHGNVYVPDWYCRVRQVTPDADVFTVVGDESWYRSWQGACLYAGDGGPAAEAGLGFPSAVAIDAEGNMFIAIASHNCVRKVDTSGLIRTIAGHCPGLWQFTGVPLSNPQGVAVDRLGNVFIADTDHGRILKLATDGTLSTIAGAMQAAPRELQ